MTDLSAYNFYQVMTIAAGQMVTCNKSEEPSRYPHEIGLAVRERESFLHSTPGWTEQPYGRKSWLGLHNLGEQ